ncbi:hypothetical protein [Escherichia coli]|uniref:hypothetical protein n=1 Tax=Escherichia coli TaxID=562 RepID=UPI0029C5D43B|nr:hypothetical protein [Escherichia coli]MDX5606349.1 hypothetical protein [Escherichia coli]HCP1358505.1 hypothetical protein [Escherichia coli]
MDNIELHRRLTMSEQELRQLKKVHQSLRDRLKDVSVMAKEMEKNKDKARQIAEPGATMLYKLRGEGVQPVEEGTAEVSPYAGKNTPEKQIKGDDK